MQLCMEVKRQLKYTKHQLNWPKLPKLCLPKFKGNVKKWHAFWELFESLIHKNSEMSPIDKFNYLSTLLEDEASRDPEPFKVYH